MTGTLIRPLSQPRDLPCYFRHSMKNIDGLTFEDAQYQLAELVGIEAERFHFLLESDKLTENEKNRYRALIDLRDGHYTMDCGIVTSSLQPLFR